MRTRLTWQNVAAPDFGDALQGTRLAGSLFSDAFANAANIAGEIREGQKDRASSAAITQALGITDPGEFARAVSTGALGDSRDFNDAALKFFQGQRSSLLGDQQTIASTANTRANTANTQSIIERREYDLNRDRLRDPIMDARADEEYAFKKEDALYNRERSRASDQREDTARELDTQATQIADEVTNNTLNPEEAKQYVATQNLPKNLEEAVLDKIDATDPAQWAVSELTRQAVVQDPVTEDGAYFGQLGESVSSRRTAANFSLGSNTELRTYASYMDRFEGSSNPIEDVIQGRFQGKEDSADLNESRASIMRDYETLTKLYDLPPEVIAGVVDSTLTQGGIGGSRILGGGKLGVDIGEAKRRLDALSTPAARNQLESTYQKYQRETARVDNFEAKYQKLLDQAALARRNGNVERVKELEEDVRELFDQFSKWDQANPVTAYDQDLGPTIGQQRRNSR